MKKPPPTITAETREMLRARIKSARASRQSMIMTPDEMQEILDAYEALRHANNRLLDLLHPRKETA